MVPSDLISSACHRVASLSLPRIERANSGSALCGDIIGGSTTVVEHLGVNADSCLVPLTVVDRAAQDACAGPGATRSADDSVTMSPSDRAVHDCRMVSAWASRMPCSRSPIRLQSPSDKLIFEPIHLRHGFSHRLDYKVRASIRWHMAGAAVTEQQLIVYGRSRHRTQRCYSDGELSCIEDDARFHS